MIALRPYQESIINQVRSHMSQGVKSILITSPTGSGKTILSAAMVKTASEKGALTWFINHRIELVQQTAKAFQDVGVQFGICAAGFGQNRSAPVQICSIQTLARRYARYKPPKLIIWDEAAHLPSSSWDRIYKMYPDAFHVLLTATPIRLDGRGLGDYAQIMVHGPTVASLIDQKFLSPYKLYAPAKVDLHSVHKRAGDYASDELSAVMDKPKIVGDAIQHYRKYADGKRALVFACSVEASKHIAEQFSLQGINARHVDGDTDREERLDIMAAFARGDIKVVSNVSLFGEGLDIQALECVIHLRPTMSLGLYLQMCGRALRAFPGKTEAIIIDAVGNVFEHGLPDEVREWSLIGRDKNKTPATPGVKICPRCFAAQFSGLQACRFCGFVFPVEFRTVQQVSGDLSEVDRQQLALKLKWKREQGMSKSLDQLIALGKQRNYKNPVGWAHVILKSRKIKAMGGR